MALEYLKFSDPVRFESVNKVTNVFFDDTNKQIIAVRSGGAMGVVVKGPRPNSPPVSFRMEDYGSVISIKFSLDQSILAVQRTKTSVEFSNFNGVLLQSEYSQSCKRNAKLLGFVWTLNNEVAFITDHGIELYMINADKKSLKLVKTVSSVVQWFVWCPFNKIVLLSSAHGSHLLPIVFKSAVVNKLPKLEIETGRMALERDVTLTTIYGVPTVLILRHSNVPQSDEIHVYYVNTVGELSIKRHVLRLNLSGKFAVNVVDNLILVHHQVSAKSLVFDIALGGESDGTVMYHTCVIPAQSLRSVSLALPGLVAPKEHICELYSSNWVVFQPNIVIDATLGCLWYIDLLLPELLHQIKSISLCTKFALRRSNAKEVLLSLLFDHIRLPSPALLDIRDAFAHINAAYRASIERELTSQTATAAGDDILTTVSSSSASGGAVTPVIIDQLDVYTALLQRLALVRQEGEGVEGVTHQLTVLEWVLVAYMTSLAELDVTAGHNLNELLLTTLVRQNKFTEVYQYIQHGVITDSKPLACLLLSLSNLNSAACQLAMDMLIRLDATEELQEVLLSQKQLLPALKTSEESVNVRKFMETAKMSLDPELFHSVLQFLNSSPNYSHTFYKDERIAQYLRNYNEIFSK